MDMKKFSRFAAVIFISTIALFIIQFIMVPALDPVVPDFAVANLIVPDLIDESAGRNKAVIAEAISRASAPRKGPEAHYTARSLW